MHNDDLSLAPKNESSLTPKGELTLATKNESSIYLMSCQSETLPRHKFVVELMLDEMSLLQVENPCFHTYSHLFMT